MNHRVTKEEKFKGIYQTYADDIYRVCIYLVKDKELAKDIMQQAFLDFYKKFENVTEDCVFAYLVHTARNIACNSK